ncbi:hypothetical protein DEAB109302_02425 [Dermacoccus abyssi]
MSVRGEGERSSAVSWPTRHAGLLTATAVALVVLSPALWRPGFLLHYDMVFVPDLPLSAGTLGMDGGVPRAVPNDTVVALLDLVLPGWITQRLVLVGAFFAIGAGLDRWRRGVVTTVVATVAATWSPWMAERLAIGHWGYLWGYAALVWAVVGALELRAARSDGDDTRHHRAVTSTAVGLGMSALSGSTGAVLVAIALVVILLAPGAGRPRAGSIAVGAAAWLLLNAAWWFPFLTSSSSSAADATGVRAFAAGADTPLGVLGSLLGGGGIWHEPSWFPERHAVVFAFLAAALVVVGFVTLLRHLPALRWGIGALGILALVLSSLGSFAVTAPLLVWFVETVPGGGLLRDGQKFVALLVVPAALGWGVLAARVVSRARGTALAPVALVTAAVLPVVLLPGLAFARGGQWVSSSYPNEYGAVAQRLSASSDAAAVLPWRLYRQYGWNGDLTVLDAWQRLSSSPVLVNDDLPLRDSTVRGESAAADRVSRALASGDAAQVKAALSRAGVRYVVVEKSQPGADDDIRTLNPIGSVVHSGRDLTLYDIGRPSGHDGPQSLGNAPWWGATGLALAGVTLAAGTAWLVRRRQFERGAQGHASGTRQ